jgi:phosphatidylserine decarboxylase
MHIHKEGYKTILLVLVLLVIIDVVSYYLLHLLYPTVWGMLLVLSVAVFLFIISFFRIPHRKMIAGENLVICPADGHVVVIEETFEPEYFKDNRIQVSIFMSPANVHLNRNPVSGEIMLSQYHKGKYLVAWHPKSSTENERHSIVIQNDKGDILVRQIAGAMARRIVNYSKQGMQIKQNEEMGFIKFGSRVDVFLPLTALVKVRLQQPVKGGKTILAEW